jgi:hypothetical protein
MPKGSISHNRYEEEVGWSGLTLIFLLLHVLHPARLFRCDLMEEYLDCPPLSCISDMVGRAGMLGGSRS